MQGLGCVRRRLIVLDDDAKAVDRGQILPLAQVVAADRHVLAGQVIPRQIDLELGIAGVLAAREAPCHIL